MTTEPEEVRAEGVDHTQHSPADDRFNGVGWTCGKCYPADGGPA